MDLRVNNMKKILLIAISILGLSVLSRASGVIVQGAGGALSNIFIRGNNNGGLLKFQNTTAPAPSLFCGSYTHQRMITISSSNVTSNLSNFPVLISTNDVTLSTASSGGHLLNPNGYDMIFSTDSSCNFKMKWDTETITTAGLTSLKVWVNVPLLDTTTLTAATFYVTYGNAGITTYQGVSSATWDSNYIAVWHFPNGTTLTANDSTGKGHTGSIDAGVTAVTGQIDGGFNSNGVGGILLTGSTDYYPPSMTTSWWMNSTDTTGSRYWIDANGGSDYQAFPVGGNLWYIMNTTGSNPLLILGGVFDGNWHYVSITYNATSGNLFGYVDGSLSAQVLGNTGGMLSSSADVRWLGWSNGGLNPNGLMDESRMSTIDRSAAWVATEYKNQFSPNTFVTIGTEQ